MARRRNRPWRARGRRSKQAAGLGSSGPESALSPLEKEIQRDVVRFYEGIGCTVLSFSQPRASMQTPGIPDLKVYLPAKRLTWWHETKTPTGRVSDDQLEMHALMRTCKEPVIVGGVEDAKSYLKMRKVLL